MFKSKEKEVLICYNKHLFLAFFQMVMHFKRSPNAGRRPRSYLHGVTSNASSTSSKPEPNPIDALMSASITYSPLTSNVSNNFCDTYPETSPMIVDQVPVDLETQEVAPEAAQQVVLRDITNWQSRNTMYGTASVSEDGEALLPPSMLEKILSHTTMLLTRKITVSLLNLLRELLTGKFKHTSLQYCFRGIYLLSV